jgi:U3 small nucleolar RNA-associated protein 13
VQPHRAPVADIAFHASGGFIATASAAREVCVWDVDSGSCTHSFSAHKGIVLCALFHSRTPILVTAGEDGQVLVCDLHKKVVASKLNGHVSAVTAIAWAAGEAHLLSAGRDKVVNVWHVGTWAKIRTVAVLEAVESLIVLPASLATDLAEKAPVPGRNIVFATGGESGHLKCWSVNSCRCVYEQQRSRKLQSIHSIVKLFMLPSAKQMLVVSADCALTVHNIGERKSSEEVKTLLGNLGEVTAVAFVGSLTMSQVPQHVAVATNSDVLYMLDTETLSCARSLRGHAETVLAVAAVQVNAPQPTWLLASGSKDNSVRVWHAATGRCVAVGEAHMGSVTCVTFFFNKQTPSLVSCGSDRLIQVWDLAPVWHAVCASKLPESPVKLSVTSAVAAHDKEVHCVAVSPTYTLVASGSADRSAKIWRLPALSAPLVLSGHKRGVWDVQFAPVDQVRQSNTFSQGIICH